jgi:hypothetical protein
MTSCEAACLRDSGYYQRTRFRNARDGNGLPARETIVDSCALCISQRSRLTRFLEFPLTARAVGSASSAAGIRARVGRVQRLLRQL